MGTTDETAGKEPAGADQRNRGGALRAALRRWRHAGRLRAQRQTLLALASATQRRIVIGSSGTAFPGWTSTDREVLDLTKETTWSRYLQPGSVDAILAEHVWEHLAGDAPLRAARICYRFLRPGGYLRIAVPDGFHPDPDYVEQVRPGGSGEGAHDHHALYDHVTLAELFGAVGFEIHLLEHFDCNGQFHFVEWQTEAGMIQRSSRFDTRNSPGKISYTSLILDAVKPATAFGRARF